MLITGWMVRWYDQEGTEHVHNFGPTEFMMAHSLEKHLGEQCRRRAREGAQGPMAVYLSVQSL